MAFYSVTTWDSELQEFTPQEGVRSRHIRREDLRRVLRELRSYGYDTSRAGGHSVLVELDSWPLVPAGPLVG